MKIKGAILVAAFWLSICQSAFGFAGGGCFLECTPVLLADGSQLPIEQIKPGDKVQAFNNDGELVSSSVRKVFRIEQEKYLLIALSIFPGSRASNHTLAMIYDQNGSWIKSDSLYLELISTDSSDAQAYNNFAYSLVERNDNLELALEMSIIANRIQPKSAPYLDTLGWIYFKLEQYDKALEYIQASYTIDNTNPVIVEH